MDAGQINRWFSEHIYSPHRPIGSLSIDELRDLLASLRKIEADLKAFEERTLTTPLDRLLGWIGVASGFIGLLTMLTTFSFLGVPLTAAGAVLSGIQVVRDRQKSMEAEWCDAKFGDLLRFADQVTRAYHRRMLERR